MLRVVKSLRQGNEALLNCGRNPCQAPPEALQSRNTMRRVVKRLGQGDEALLELGRKLRQALSEALQGRDTMPRAKHLGKANEALLERDG